jgi:glycosyltransferase involved in cell wall biosynthesis
LPGPRFNRLFQTMMGPTSATILSPDITRAEVTGLTPIALTPLSGDRPLVSVLMANYNYALYLPEAIESVLNQSYANWELVICDDGSTDASLDVIEQYAQRDPRVRLIVKPNGGHASALNAAHGISKGEIVCLLDSDDLYDPRKIERVVDYCRARPDCGLIAHRVIRVNQRRRKQGVWPLLNSLPNGWFGTRLLEEGGILPFLPPTSGLSLRRELAERLFPMPTHRPLDTCPDQVIVRLAPLITPVGSLDQALAEYRLHTANSYGASRVTVASLDRELEFGRALWQQQYTFLSQTNSWAAQKLKPVNATEYFCFVRYLRAKLCKDRSAKELHEIYLQALRQVRPGGVAMSFWRLSYYLPRFLFGFAINLFLGQNVLKRFVAQVKGLV